MEWVAGAVSGIQMSAIKEMAMRSASRPGSVSLAWGLPSFPTPGYVLQGVSHQLLCNPEIGMYSLPDGIPELRRVVADRHLAETGVRVDPDRHVIISAGNMEASSVLLRTILEPGDEVIVTDPGFSSHFIQIRLKGGRPVLWRLDEARDWSLDLDALPALITQRSKAILLVTPSNPTGTVFSERQLRQLAEIAVQRGLLVIVDDPYSCFTYDGGQPCFNPAAIPELAPNLAYLFTLSKAYAMSGWRIGYMILPEQLKRQVLKVHDATLICPPRISQVGALVALSGESLHIEYFRTELARRRELMFRRLDRMADVFAYAPPGGAYYVFPRILAPHRDSRQFCLDMLSETGVAMTPGGAFGPSGEHHVRLAFCVSEMDINDAFDRLERHFHGRRAVA